MSMFGGGGMMGGLHAPGSGNSAPFAGVPSEMADGVAKLMAVEPEHDTSKTDFTHQRTERSQLSLWRLLAQQRKAVLFACFLVVVETITLQAGPYLTQIGIDDGIVGHNLEVILLAAGLFVVAVVLTAVASRFRVRTTGYLAARVMHILRIRVFRQLQRLSLDYYTSEKAGVILTRMTSDIEILQQLLQDGLVQFAIQGLTMVIVTAVLFSYDVELALITVVLILPILTALSLWFRKASDTGYSRVRDGLAGVLSDLSESLHGVRVVATHNRQWRNIRNHRGVLGQYRDANDHTAVINAVYGPGTQMIGFLGQGALLIIGGGMVLDGRLSIGVLTAFILYLGTFFQPIQQLVQLYNSYQQGRAAIIKLRGLLDDEPSVAEATDAVDLPRVEGEIRFENVDFAYNPDAPVLSDVDLHIRAGETVALVGPTGAGKSTLAKLIVRFYDPTGGRVLLDGHDLRSVTFESLRHQLGVVPQEPFLFTGTIRDNVAFGRPEATDDEIWEAVHTVGLTDLLERLPDALDTHVDERGGSLSSGERQLIGLARAFIGRPRVLVLDEATSNLDLASERKVETALDLLLEGRTAVLVAHRLSTAMRADRIAVVDKGGILEIGPHSELIEHGGVYARMYATWISHSEMATH